MGTIRDNKHYIISPLILLLRHYYRVGGLPEIYQNIRYKALFIGYNNYSRCLSLDDLL